jgi:2-polyprenyl-3-methyl-5-hydroxy-6-metoxy-1,4-benzoquinol methylase
MPVTTCRICNHPFFAEPLLCYDNMPRAAQNLPTAAMLAEDHGGSLEICQCTGCGLVQLGNDPVPYYREVIRSSAFSEEMRGFRMRQFDDFVRKFKLKGKKVIEPGCGRGEYLSLMKQAGADAYGIEYADDAVRECCNSGLNVTKGFMDSRDLVLNGMPFDAFFIMNFLEHLPDPNAALSGICNNLTVDGIGLVEVPNFDMILNRSLFSEFIGDHLFYFTRDTLATALQLNGFEVLSCDEIWHDYILSAVVIKREKTDMSRFHQHQSGLKAAIADYIGQFGAGQTAIWGAGHQALAVMALAGLEGKIKYVIDSAPFKQGRYTPATHIPIVAPETLDSDPADAIIVIAAAYSDEVARIIRHKFDKNISVAILRDHGLEAVK